MASHVSLLITCTIILGMNYNVRKRKEGARGIPLGIDTFIEGAVGTGTRDTDMQHIVEGRLGNEGESIRALVFSFYYTLIFEILFGLQSPPNRHTYLFRKP